MTTRASPPSSIGGRYLLGELIGEGGSAKVYRATDIALGREVAVKLLHEHVLDNDRRRFEREIRTLAHVTHPGVVTIHDLGHDESGRLFFAMQLLLGGPINVLGPLEDHPESLRRLCAAGAFVARALDHVHARGVVHRDLTPHNILLGEDGVPRVMDFGLVYLSEGTRDLTRAGYTLGTPQYMAPEQARGGEVGPHSDLYALGAVLYRVAAGRAPFEGESDQAVLYQHVYEPPTPPEVHNPAVPAALSRVLLRLLEKEPGRRPASGEHAARLLEAALSEVAREQAGGQFRGGRARAGEHAGGPADARGLRERWHVQLDGEITWPAAVTASGSLIAVGTRRSKLCLVDQAGRRYADLPAGDEVNAPATLHGGLAVYGAWDGQVRAAELVSGLERWRWSTRAEVTGAPTLWRDHYLIPSRDGHLHCVGAARGELAWAYRAGSPVAASPALWAGHAFIADEDGWLHAVNAGSGALLWKVQLSTVHATPAVAPLSTPRLGTPRLGTPRLGGAALIVPCWQGEVQALHLRPRGGLPMLADDALWTYDLEDELWASPAADAERVYLATWGGQVRALGLREAEEVWSRQLEGRITASPVLSERTLYVASEAGEVLALSADSGETLWSARFEVGVQATPLIHQGALYVAFMNGSLRSFW